MEVIIGLLIAAVPQLAPFAPLLRIAPSVISAIRVAAPIAGGWIQAVHKESPELVPVFEQLAARLNLSGHKAADAAAQMMFDHDGTLWMQASGGGARATGSAPAIGRSRSTAATAPSPRRGWRNSSARIRHSRSMAGADRRRSRC